LVRVRGPFGTLLAKSKGGVVVTAGEIMKAAEKN
jgi:hypothetical protein